MSPSVVIDWAGEPIELRPERAALLLRHKTLLVADVHLGKARAFRQQGVPVPGGTTAETLARLDALVRATGADRVVFLGDLLHSRHAQGSAALDEFARWRAAHATLALTLVRGNHDAHAGDPPDALRIDVVEEPFALGGLALCHHPEAHAPRRASLRAGAGVTLAAPAKSPGDPGPSGSFMADALELAATKPGDAAFVAVHAAHAAGDTGAPRRAEVAAARMRNASPALPSARPRVAGHVHPCFSLHGRSDSLRLPCFHFAAGVAVLPAFGAFTGMHAIHPAPGDRVWVVAADRVVAVPVG
jgi:DNA ligase-associated metallophosphoesterase